MLRRILRGAAAGVVAGAVFLALPLSSAAAQGVIPGLTLTFDTPTGTVGQHDPIDVFMTLTLDPSANPFSFDGTNPPDFGLDPLVIPTMGDLESDGSAATFVGPFTAVFLNIQLDCSGTFNNCLPGPAYTFAAGTLGGTQHFSLSPGGSFGFLFGTWSPSGGTAAPGTYTMQPVDVIAEFVGVDGDGHAMTDNVDLARTCSTCTFTRDVTPDVSATPEPATFGLFATGLGVVGFVRRHSRKRISNA